MVVPGRQGSLIEQNQLPITDCMYAWVELDEPSSDKTRGYLQGYRSW